MQLQEGIILKSIDYQENSKIIYIMTNQGIKSGIVRGATKLTSPTYAYSQVLSKIAYDIKKDRLITSAKAINQYKNIKNNLETIKYCMQIMEISYTLGSHISDYEIFYTFLSEVLDLIDEGLNPLVILILFQVKTLYLLGIAPVFTKCVSCQTKKNLVGFSFNDGGMKCSSCLKNDDYVYSSDVIDILKVLYLTKISCVKERIINNENLVKSIDKNKIKINKFIELYYNRYIGFNSNVIKIMKDAK